MLIKVPVLKNLEVVHSIQTPEVPIVVGCLWTTGDTLVGASKILFAGSSPSSLSLSSSSSVYGQTLVRIPYLYVCLGPMEQQGCSGIRGIEGQMFV